MSRLLLLSNSTNPGEEYLQYSRQHIREFLGDSVKRVLFIPYAAVGFSYDAYTAKVSAPFQEIGYQVEGIHTLRDARQGVLDAECIIVGGGNTFALLKLLYDHDLLEAIRDRVVDGLPYIGWSAGSNVAGPAIKTTNDMPIVEPPSFDALHLVPFQINPHYTEQTLPNHGGETRKDRIHEFIALNPKVKVVGIPEGNLLKITDDEVRLLGSGEVKVFEQNQETRVCTYADDLSFLLN